MSSRVKKRYVRALKKAGLIPRWQDLQYISRVKNFLWGRISWREFAARLALGAYLEDTLPEGGVYIEPPVDMHWGGTMEINVELIPKVSPFKGEYCP